MERIREERHEFGIVNIGIPFEVLFHPALSNTEKMLYGFIRNLSATANGCFATNAYLAGLMNLSKDRISKSVGNLKHYEIIDIEYLEEGTYNSRRIIPNPEYYKIYLKMLTPRGYKKITRGVIENAYTPMRKHLGTYYTTYNIEEDSKVPFQKSIFKILPEEWLDDENFMEALVSYTLHRKQKKSAGPLTLESSKKMAHKLSKYDVEIAAAALNMTVDRGWTGVFPDKVDLPETKAISDKVLHGETAEEVINSEFKASYAKKFYSLYLEAEKILTVDAKRYGPDLAHHLIGLRGQVMTNQSAKATGELSIPSGAGIVSAYIGWLGQQKWLDNIKPSAFDFGGTLFEQFIMEYSKSIGYDILAGTMV